MACIRGFGNDFGTHEHELNFSTSVIFLSKFVTEIKKEGFLISSYFFDQKKPVHHRYRREFGWVSYGA